MKPDMIDPAELKGYDDWMVAHLDEAMQQHPGKIIAVYAGKIIAVGDSYKEVYATAKAQGIEDSPFVMEVPRPDEVQHMLPSAF